MSRHVFLSPDGEAHARWLEAFPALEARTGPPAAGTLRAGDVLWVCAELPDAMDVVARFARRDPASGIVVVSLHPREDEALAAFDAGARGYCHAWSVPELLRQVGVVVANGGMWIGAELMSRVIAATRRLLPLACETEAPGLELLTGRERDVALAVARGLTNKEVARELDITERTVKAHLGMVFDKLGIRDRLQLVLHLSGAGEQAGAAI